MRQRSRITYLAEGDANTRFFHLQACHRNKKSFIPTITVDDVEIIHEEAKREAINTYFEEILGPSAPDSINLDFPRLCVPTSDLPSLDYCFSEEEVWETIKELPSDRAPGPMVLPTYFIKQLGPSLKMML
jgi:hypothetical protein